MAAPTQGFRSNHGLAPEPPHVTEISPFHFASGLSVNVIFYFTSERQIWQHMLC